MVGRMSERRAARARAFPAFGQDGFRAVRGGTRHSRISLHCHALNLDEQAKMREFGYTPHMPADRAVPSYREIWGMGVIICRCYVVVLALVQNDRAAVGWTGAG